MDNKVMEVEVNSELGKKLRAIEHLSAMQTMLNMIWHVRSSVELTGQHGGDVLFGGPNGEVEKLLIQVHELMMNDIMKQSNKVNGIDENVMVVVVEDGGAVSHVD